MDCKRVTVIRIGPVIYHQKEKALHSKRVVSFLLLAKRVEGLAHPGERRAWTARGSRFDPGILHQKKKHYTETCGVFFYTDAEKGGSFPQKGKPPPLLIIG